MRQHLRRLVMAVATVDFPWQAPSTLLTDFIAWTDTGAPAASRYS